MSSIIYLLIPTLKHYSIVHSLTFDICIEMDKWSHLLSSTYSCINLYLATHTHVSLATCFPLFTRECFKLLSSLKYSFRKTIYYIIIFYRIIKREERSVHILLYHFHYDIFVKIFFVLFLSLSLSLLSLIFYFFLLTQLLIALSKLLFVFATILRVFYLWFSYIYRYMAFSFVLHYFLLQLTSTIFCFH